MSDEHGRITDDGVAKLRARIGQGFPGRRPWRTEVTRDAIYHLALAIGDLSPLYLDEEYARKTTRCARSDTAGYPRDSRACTRSGPARTTSGSAR